MALLSQLFFLVFLQRSNAFTFKLCPYYYQYENECLKNDKSDTYIFEENDFIPEQINIHSTNYCNVTLDLSDHQNLIINFDNFSSDFLVYFYGANFKEITIETNMLQDSYKKEYPSIYAPQFDILIDNKNQDDKTFFYHTSIECNTLSPKNANRPFYLSSFNSHSQVALDLKIFTTSSTVYFSKSVELSFIEPLDSQLTLIYLPVASCHIDSKDYEEYCNENAYLTLRVIEKASITYGKRQITYNFNNIPMLTIKSDSPRFGVINKVHSLTVISCEENIDGEEIFMPSFESNSLQTDPVESFPVIKGNWPIVKDDYIDGFFLPNGSYVNRFWKSGQLQGRFLFSATNFPVHSLSYLTLVLTENSSSVSQITDWVYFPGNFTIITESDVDTVFAIDGKAVEFDREGFIVTNSSKLTVLLSAQNSCNHDGPATIRYKKIDNSQQLIETPMIFQNGGSITLPYTVDYMNLKKLFDEIYDGYKKENPEPSNDNASDWANYEINFAKNKISELSELINSVNNHIIPLTIIPQGSSDQKSTISIPRNDFPFSNLYLNALGKVSNILCAESGLIGGLSNWNIKIGQTIIRGLFGEDYDDIFPRFFPTFANTFFNYSFVETENGRCIGFKPESAPVSSIEFVVYTTNTTYMQILEKIDLFIKLTESDLDAAHKLKNVNTKNIIVLVLDDLPEGKSINLNGIRKDANIFLIGFKSQSVEEIYRVIEDLDNLNNQDLSSDEYEQKEKEIITRITSKYQSYQTKASVTFDTVQTFAVALVDYYGTHVKCENFYAFLSSFSSIDSLKNDFSAATTLTETLTYRSIEGLTLSDLVLLPVSNDPPNLMVAQTINFTSTQWILILRGQPDGYKIEETREYAVNYANVHGKLIVYSLTLNSEFHIPEAQEKIEKVRGITVNSHFTNFKVNDIPGIMTLESKEKSFFSRMKHLIRPFSSLLEETTNDDEISVFTGDWKDVEVVGYFEIDTGDSKAIIRNVPTNVLRVIDVRSDKDVEVQAIKNEGEIENVKFTLPQVISQPKKVNFENMNVSYSNLTFTGTSSSFSLNNGEPKVITDHINIATGTTASIDNDLYVVKSFEFWPGSKLECETIEMEHPNLTINYRLQTGIKIPPYFYQDDKSTPENVILNYIGESDNVEEAFDYDSHVGEAKTIFTFSNDAKKEKCEEMKNKINLDSSVYNDFRGSDSVVEVSCVDGENDNSNLVLNLTTLPREEIIRGDDQFSIDSIVSQPVVPVFTASSIFSPSESPLSESKKKKLSIGAIVGIVIAVIAAIAIISVLIWYFAFYKKKNDVLKDLSINEDDSVGI